MKEQPTGFIRTLPAFYRDESTEGGKAHAKALRDLEADDSNFIWIGLSSRPKEDVLHVYLCIGGEINLRLNLSEIRPGESGAKCFDGTKRSYKYWAICTGPVSRPPEPIPRRGFQGHRYTPDLW